MNIELICVGKLKDRFYEDAAEEYCKRIGAFGKIKITEIAAARLPEKPGEAEIAAALEAEGDAILKKIPGNAAVYPLCIEGKPVSSEQLAAELKRAAVNGCGTAVFLIGGSFGLSERVKARGALRLSMSPMTFPHRLARIMLLEQIYRSFMINEGRTYHK